jgi:hypothetical protein
MPDPVDLDLAALTRSRQELASVTAEQTAVRVELAGSQATLEQLRRTVTDAAALADAERAVAELEARRATLHDRRSGLMGGIGDLATELLADRDIGDSVRTLDANLPIAMLPVRIETRFAPDLSKLDIRIYPDQVHLDGHEPEFTDDERQAAEWYWQQRWAALGDGDVAEQAWQTVAGRFRPGRARYLVETLRPTNIAPAGTPEFPDTPRRASSWTRAVEATALPEHWVAVGYQAGEEVFRVWSKTPVPDRLAAGPTPAPEEAPAEQPEVSKLPNVQDALRWALDLDAARDAGMALTVNESDLTQGHTLAHGLTRLVVAGVDWTLTPDAAAEALEDLLASHAATGDLAFVAPGTPTNNTGAQRSAFSTAPSEQVAEWAPPVTGDDPDVSPDVAAGRLAAALGVAPAALAAAPGAGGRHHRTESALVDALWEATGGYFLRELLDPLAPDALTEELRVYAAEHLHAGGPLPTIRVGPQPYGVLPVVARRYGPTPGDRAEAAIARVGGAMRSLWQRLTANVPHLGRAGEQRGVEDIVLDLLQRTPVPWSLRWRDMTPPPQWSSTDWMTLLRTHQAPYLYTVTDLLGVSNTNALKVQYLTATDQALALNVPLVSKGDAGTSYIAEIAGLAQAGTSGRRDLNLRQNSIALLEALLAFAACQEMDLSASKRTIVGLTVEAAQAAGFTKAGVRATDLIRVEQADVVSRPPLQFTTSRQLADTVLSDTGVFVHDQVAADILTTPIIDILDDPASPVHSIARFLAASDVLAQAPAEEIEWAFRGVLDLFSSRLDAWLTALAHGRLARQRAARPTGIHLGCYGWVEDLRPDSGAGAESLGHVLTPSLGHAVAAAVLRSGRQAHAGSGAFELDLSSHRVREAMALLEGVAAGQSIAALVGYRIERRLRDAQLADLTVPLRLEAPLQSRDDEHDEPVESVAARDVVDGVKLLSLFAGPANEWEALVGRVGAEGRRTQLEFVLRSVAENYDAVTDVLFAECVHQLTAGNLERASAAAGALDRQERPVEADVVRTPRAGAMVTNRVLVSLQSDAAAAVWPQRGARGRVEPRLDGWLGTVLGDPAALTATGRLVRRAAVEDEPDVVTDLGTVSAAELGLSPLALALTAERPAPGGMSELGARICAVLSERVADLGPDDRIECDDLSVLHTVAAWAGRLVGGSRPLAGTDLSLAEVSRSVVAGTVDLDELRTRVDGCIAAVRAAADGLAGAAGDAASLRGALLDVAELVGGEALPAARPGQDDEEAALAAQAAEVAELLAARVSRLQELAARPLGADDDPVVRQVELAAIALGAEQPVLPVFSLTSSDELGTSLADRAALLGDDDTAVMAWLDRASLVRPEVDPLCGLLLHAEATGVDIVGEVAVAQLPHRPGARWCELPFGPEGPPPAGTVGLVVVSSGGFDPAQPQAGLFIDAWTEVIPATEHTAGLTFNYDAPGARPPQAIVLAVHPDPTPDRWDIDTVLDTVDEVAELAKLRTLSLKEIEGFAGLIPALYLPNNYTRDVPSVPIRWIVASAAEAGLLTKAATAITGK